MICYTLLSHSLDLPDKLSSTSLQLAVKTLPFYSDYFGTPYPLPKVDLITIPDFAERAMENWGLITYR